MKNLKDILVESNNVNYEVVNEKKGKQVSAKVLKEFIANNEYAVIVQKYRMEQYVFDSYPEYCVSPSEIYILEAGDASIAKVYGQDKYNSNSLSGQAIDGAWPHENTSGCKETKAALEEFSRRTGIDATKAHNPFNEDDYMVWFYRCEWLQKSMKGRKIFDTRTLLNS